MTEWLLSAFTTVFGIGGILLAAGAVAAFIYLPRLAPYVLFAAAACGALGYVDRLQDDLDVAEGQVTVLKERLATAEAAAASNANLANSNAEQAKREAEDNKRQAEAYAADAAAARTDADRFDLARQAAEFAASAKPDCPLVGQDVRNALVGNAVRETDGLAPSLKAASEALRKGRRR